MHIPDGFLSPPTWISAWAIALGGIGGCVRLAARSLRDKTVPLMGVTAAFIFAAQMINFPVPGGTSGHLLGGALAAVLLGPFAGPVVLTCVLVGQCLVFSDGGLTALGANVVNMALLGSGGGYFVYWIVARAVGGRQGIIAGAAAAGWFSVVAAASLCAAELAFSGTSPLAVVLPAMALVHAFIGVGEAVVTALIVGFVLKIRPDLVYAAEEDRP